MNDNEYYEILTIFRKNEKSFDKRKKEMDDIHFSKINWSDSYLDFTPYSSIINQQKKTKIFKEEKADSIKNHFLDNKLIYSYKNQNENWGTVFVEYFNDQKIWFLFVENDDDKMILQQLKIVCYQQSKITKRLFYLSDKDAEEETFMIDLFKYNKENRLKSIIRNGFYEKKSAILSEREISFEYDNGNMKVYSSQEGIGGDVKKTLIYCGKK